MTLIDRIEAAGPEQQRELLTEVWQVLSPVRWPDGIVPWREYTAMLDCGAYESAALMFVPEGWGYTASASAELNSHHWELWNPLTGGRVDAKASTPALAFLAARLKAQEKYGV